MERLDHHFAGAKCENPCGDNESEGEENKDPLDPPGGFADLGAKEAESCSEK